MSKMYIQRRSIDDIAVIDVHGPLRADTVPALQQCVSAVLRRGHRKLVLNVANLTALDAAGLGEIVQAHTLTRGVNGRVKLVSDRPAVQKLLICTQLLPAFDVYASEAAALASFGAAVGCRC